MGNNQLSHAADGTFTDNINPGSVNKDGGHDPGDGTLSTNFDDTENTLASKGFVVLVSHGLQVGNGATTTIMKKVLLCKGQLSGAETNLIMIAEQQSICPDDA